MLNEKELLEFLRLLAAFNDAVALSATNTGVLLGISKKTICRWLAAARDVLATGNTPSHSVYRYQAAQAINKINRLNALDATQDTYANIINLSPSDKLRALHTAMDPRA